MWRTSGFGASAPVGTTTHSGLQVLQLTDRAWSDCRAAPSDAATTQVAATTMSPLDALILNGRSVGVGSGFCLVPKAAIGGP